ncbi:Maltase A1 [Armadillidium vulgare]|nr:Maltase A1 [Armadillidium vulgare]
MDIYPRSFYDSDGDGVGDIKGITEKSDYLVDLGVEMIWLNPVLKSPMKDFGYDISDFRAIDPIFGTMEDYENMLKEMHSKNIKVIFDFVPNHTSDQHEWFIKSVQNDPKYKDYYVWKDPKGYNSTGAPIPPNNWVSIFRFSAWEWSEERKQFYLHKFLKEQPDLNYRNPEVVKEMNDVIRFWLDKGVDGFRVDAIQNLVEDVSFADEPPAANSGITDPTLEGYYNHIYTLNQPETIDVIRGWHEVLESYKDRFMTLEVYDEDVKEIMKFYGNETNPVSDFPFNFFFINKLSGMVDAVISFEDTQDPAGINMGPAHYRETSRDPERNPMQWMTLKMQFGTIEFAVATEEVLAFVRSYEGSPTYLVVINTSPEETTIDVQNGDVKLPDSATVVIRSITDTREETNVGSTVNLSSVSLQGGEGLVLLVEE